MAAPIAVESVSRRGDGRISACCSKMGEYRVVQCMNWRWCTASNVGRWQVMLSSELACVMQKGYSACRQRRILLWALMRQQRVFATTKLPPPRSPATHFHCCLSAITYQKLFCYMLHSLQCHTIDNIPGYTGEPSPLPTNISLLPMAMSIAIAGDRGDFHPSNVMLHCTTRYWTPHGRSPLLRI